MPAHYNLDHSATPSASCPGRFRGPGGGLAVRRAPAEGGGADCLLKPLGYLPFRSYNSALGS